MGFLTALIIPTAHLPAIAADTSFGALLTDAVRTIDAVMYRTSTPLRFVQRLVSLSEMSTLYTDFARPYAFSLGPALHADCAQLLLADQHPVFFPHTAHNLPFARWTTLADIASHLRIKATFGQHYTNTRKTPTPLDWPRLTDGWSEPAFWASTSSFLVRIDHISNLSAVTALGRDLWTAAHSHWVAERDAVAQHLHQPHARIPATRTYIRGGGISLIGMTPAGHTDAVLLHRNSGVLLRPSVPESDQNGWADILSTRLRDAGFSAAPVGERLRPPTRDTAGEHADPNVV